MRLAAAVLAADRLSPRRPPGVRGEARGLAWKRRLQLKVNVEDPDRWLSTVELLSRLLSFMTDDDWDVSFCPGHSRAVQLRLLPAGPEPSAVALFSGGLDSAAGLLVAGRNHRGIILAVSAHANEVRLGTQRQAVHRAKELGASVHWAPVCTRLIGAKRPRSFSEQTQRSRAFLFLALGAAAASAVGHDSFDVYETGVGCLNLPFSSAQVGAQATKALHPRTLDLFNALVKRVMDKPARVMLPFFLLTKGDLCKRAGPEVLDIARLASSCDEGDGHKVDPMLHCGVCTSCVFRRIALHAAGHGADPTKYRNQETRQHGRYELALFASHAADLRARPTFATLLDLDPDLRFAACAPLREPMSRENIHNAVALMYRRYASEIESFMTETAPRVGPKRDAPRPDRRKPRDLFSAAR